MQLPPLPPSNFNSHKNIRPEVCEQILRRALAVEHEWQREESCRPAHNFFDTNDPTHCLSLLPGGRFLAVASVEPSSLQPYLTIWDLECPTDRPFLPDRRRAALVRTALPGKVDEMTAKYIPYKGNQGIVVAVAGPARRQGYKFVTIRRKSQSLTNPTTDQNFGPSIGLLWKRWKSTVWHAQMTECLSLSSKRSLKTRKALSARLPLDSQIVRFVASV